MRFPTSLHSDVVDIVVTHFAERDGVDAVLLVGSCARGAATPESDVDIAVVSSADAHGRRALEEEWSRAARDTDTIRRFVGSSLPAAVHLDVIDGNYEPTVWDDGGGPDDFELEIGNQVAYSDPLWQRGRAFEDLRAKWLPYYEEQLRLERLDMVRRACEHDLSLVPFYVERELYFQAFDRLYKAFQEFLQALFISRATYPLAYNKWIRYQVEELLSMPELYAELPRTLEVGNLESRDVTANAAHLSRLVERFLHAG